MLTKISLPASDDSSRWYPLVPAKVANCLRPKRLAPLSYCYLSLPARYHRASWSSFCTIGRTQVFRSQRESGQATIVPRSSCTWEVKVLRETCIPTGRSSWQMPWPTWTKRYNPVTEVQSERKNIILFWNFNSGCLRYKKSALMKNLYFIQ